MRKIFVFVVVLSIMGLTFSAVGAQGDNPVVVDGLEGPRQLFVDADGSLYIAESGSGGMIEVQGVFGPASGGGTATVTRVEAAGTRSTFLYGLQSRYEAGELLGATALTRHEGVFWLLMGQSALNAPFTYAAVALDPETLRVTQFIDIYGAEASQNPDGAIVDSNPVDIAVINDMLYIVDAGCNCVWRRSLEPNASFTALEVAHVWDNNPVPTAIAADGSGGYFVSFLTGFPFAEGSAMIEHYDANGALLATFTGLTTVVDVLSVDGTLYATEFARFGETGWMPETGRVVAVTPDGIATVAEGLTFPYGLAVDAGGRLLVSVNASYTPEGTGQVIALEIGAGGFEVAEPAATPEVGG